MKGLLKNQFYGAISSAVVLLVFFVAVGIVLIVSGNSSLLNIYVLVTATAFALNAVSSFRKEASSKWSKYQLTTPVGRKDIVRSRFINHTFWVLAGIILAALFVCLAVFIHGNRYFYYDLRDPLMLFCCGTGIALLMGAIFYPTIYLLEAGKSEIIMMISLLSSVGITAGIIWMLNALYDFKPLSDTEFYLNMIIYLAIVLISFLLSYFLTIFIYRRKEC